MRKLFFAIYFIIVSSFVNVAYSATRELIDINEIEQLKSPQRLTPAPKTPELPKTREEMIKYLVGKDRVIPRTSLDDMKKYTGMSVIHSDEYIAQQAQASKSTFEKIYEETMSKISLDEQNYADEIVFSDTPSEAKLYSEMALQNSLEAPLTEDFEVINVKLPNGIVIQSPAKEHIPYLASIIEIMPDGLIHIHETVTVVANAQKLKYGLVKALPKYSISREGVKESTIPYLTKVTINGTEAEYVLKDAFDRFLITPKNNFLLQPGIYTYEFDYILDRKLWHYDEFNEFYWDVTGSFWNLAVNYATAVVRLPSDVEALGETLMLGYLPDRISEQGGDVVMNKVTKALGFVALRPLFAGEGMHILIRIPKKGFIDPDFNKKFKWFLEDYGDILFASFALLAILLAYMLSWHNIDASASETAKIRFRKTPALYRLLARGKYDKVSFGGFLLDMYRRGIIDIINEDENVSLIKRTNNLKNLSRYEKKSLKELFAGKKSSLTVSPKVALALDKASRHIEKDTNKRIKWLLMRLNFLYVLLSAIMVVMAEIAIAYLKVDTWSIFGVLVACTITIAFYWSILTMKIRNKFLSFGLKILALLLIVFSGLIMSNHVHIVTVLLVIAMIYTIFKYGRLFSKREGLIRHNVAEAMILGNNLSDNAKAIVLGGQFPAQQANIFVLDAADDYEDAPEIKNVNKMDLVKKVIAYCK